MLVWSTRSRPWRPESCSRGFPEAEVVVRAVVVGESWLSLSGVRIVGAPDAHRPRSRAPSAAGSSSSAADCVRRNGWNSEDILTQAAKDEVRAVLRPLAPQGCRRRRRGSSLPAASRPAAGLPRDSLNTNSPAQIRSWPGFPWLGSFRVPDERHGDRSAFPMRGHASPAATRRRGSRRACARRERAAQAPPLLLENDRCPSLEGRLSRLGAQTTLTRPTSVEVGVERVGGDDDQDLGAALAVLNEPSAGTPLRISNGRVPERV